MKLEPMSVSRRLRRQVWRLRLRQMGRLRRLDDLRRWQWLTREQAAAQQQERLAALLAHAAAHVPYYRDLLPEAGVVDAATGAVDLSRFTRIPLLDRETVRARNDDLKSDDLASRSIIEKGSGGTTGALIHFVQDSANQEWVFVSKMLFDEWTGMAPGDPQVRLWSATGDVWASRASFKKRAGRWLRNELWLEAFAMTPDTMRDFLRQIGRYRPVQIMGYAESLDALAALAEEEGLSVFSPAAVMTAATTLEPQQRERIGRVFGAPVFDRYGAREVGDIACECERHDGLHVQQPTHLVEVLRPDGSPAGPGELGEVVVTLLTNYAMPFIRYRIGDMASWAAGECSCGRPWPVLERVHGRVSELFVNEEGGVVPGYYFSMPFFNEDLVAQYQVVQESVDDIRLLLVPAEGAAERLTDGWLADIAAIYRKAIGPGLQVRIEIVDQIPLTKTGKHRGQLSKVPSAFTPGREPPPAGDG